MIYKVIEKYGSNEDTTKILAEKLSQYLTEEECESLAKDIYESTQGKHFDECFAKAQIKKMYYEENGIKHYAPYWEDTSSIYQVNKRKLQNNYNRWDFDVTMNMIKSDYYPLLKRWFPDEQDLLNRIVELAINWLNDEDYEENKIWVYFR